MRGNKWVAGLFGFFLLMGSGLGCVEEQSGSSSQFDFSQSAKGTTTRIPASTTQTVPASSAPEPVSAETARPAQETSFCDPNYSGCVPIYPPDVDCADIGYSVAILGSDPHELDIDGDGYGCTSNDNVYDVNGYNDYGYDENGYDRSGYDQYGYDRYGYDRYGYDQYGYDQYGYDQYGYDMYGYDEYGNDEYGNDDS